MKIFYDFEFLDNGPNKLMPLSIGLSRMDGKSYYAEHAECDRSLANAWVKENVIPIMTGPVKPTAQITQELVEFCGPKPEFWGYFAAYDWLLMTWQFGTFMDLPKHWPRHTNDILHVGRGQPYPPQTSIKHHALNDAVWTREAYLAVTKDLRQKAFQDMLDLGQELDLVSDQGLYLPPKWDKDEA